MDQHGWSRRRFLQGSVLACGVAATAGCGALGFGDTLGRIREAGVVRLGIAGERPYAFFEGDQLVGATAAVHRAVFRRIGEIEVEGVLSPFGELIEGLTGGSYDAVAAGMFVTANRCDLVSFSDPVYCAPTGLLVASGNPLGLRDFASVARAGARLVVLGGAVEHDYARAVGVPADRIVAVGSQDDGLEAVASGEADAFALTSVSLRSLLERARQDQPLPGAPAPAAEQVELVEPFTPTIDGAPQLGCGAAAFRGPDEELRAAFNRELAALRTEGGLLALMAPYGFTATEMPAPEVTTEQLCSVGGVSGTELDPLPR
ncbi:MAG TPA: ectoine/hydroxyectoine ABC transporter substrate-binding protein EhuB [Pseudonocardia sp.]|nr:ectoine/hydroxyectoine ABC transporter substrate-binding protein EhuB [Pseudonocardia sp.]